jgi:hypothetical protein
MATWWRVNRYTWKIEPVDVKKETPHFIEVYGEYWKQTRRVAKGNEYFPTFAAARTRMVDIASGNANTAQRDLEYRDYGGEPACSSCEKCDGSSRETSRRYDRGYP